MWAIGVGSPGRECPNVGHRGWIAGSGVSKRGPYGLDRRVGSVQTWAIRVRSPGRECPNMDHRGWITGSGVSNCGP
eukprot:5987714-Pyramimonas_sp.AAC.1